MRSIDDNFYRTRAWSDCREAYLRSVGGLCERCLKKEPPQYNGAKIVHHKIHLTAENVKNPAISMAFSNLEALCQECHNKEHFGEDVTRRYSVDANGKVT